MTRTLVLCCLASLGVMRPLPAQRPEGPWRAPAVRPSSFFRNTPPTSALFREVHQADSVSIPSTHWMEGGLLVGAAFGVLGAIGAVQLCGYDSVCHSPGVKAVGGFVFGALVGFGVGALIGGQFPKHGAPFRS